MPLGQAVTTDWDSQARWLRIPQLTGRKKNRSWLDIQTVWIGQLCGLQEFRAEPCNGIFAQSHWSVLTCGPVPLDILSFLCPPFRKLRKKESHLLCTLFPHSVEMRTVSFVPVWKPPCRYLCVQPFPHRLEKAQPHISLSQHIHISLRCDQQTSAGSQTAWRQQASPAGTPGLTKLQQESPWFRDESWEETSGCSQLRASLGSPECRQKISLMHRLLPQSHFYHVVIFAVSLEL